MSPHPFRILAALLLSLAALAQEAPRQGSVVATRLNVRARPGTQYEVVCQVQKGDVVTVVAQQDDWVGIRPPADTRAFVPNRILAGAQVTTDTRVYAGPGAVFSDIARLREDDTVTILRRHSDDWTQIRAPEHAVVWVATRYIDLPEQDAATTAAAPPDGVQTYADGEAAPLGNADGAAAVTVTDPPAAQPPPKIHQIAGLPDGDARTTPRPIGSPSDYDGHGTIIPLPADYQPFAYALAIEIDGVHYPLAYLRGNDQLALADHLGAPVRITGTRRWLDKWPRPLIDVAAIQAIEPAAP